LAFLPRPSGRRGGLNADSYAPLPQSVYRRPRSRTLASTAVGFGGQSGSFPPGLSPTPMARPALCLDYQAWNRQVPRAPLLASGVTSGDEMSSTSSEGVTPPSSLLRAHVSNQIPPPGFGRPIPAGLCRLLSAPAGTWPFPTLSPQSVLRCLDPYPAASPLVIVRLGPERASASPQMLMVRHAKNSRQCNFYRGMITRRQSFPNVQAP
jgi:hypothetical protein